MRHGDLEGGGSDKTNSKAGPPVIDPHGNVDKEQECSKCKTFDRIAVTRTRLSM